MVLPTIASSEDSTMVASRSRVSIAACSRTRRSRCFWACSRSAITAANVRPDAESSAKNTSSRTALVNGEFCAKGPNANAVLTVAMVATRSVDSVAPLTPKRMAAHMTNGSTAKDRKRRLGWIVVRLPKMSKDASESSNRSTPSSAMRAHGRILRRSGKVKTRGVTSNTPVASPSQ